MDECIHKLSVSVVFQFGLERYSYSVIESEEVVTVCVTVDRANVSGVFTATLFTRDATTQGNTQPNQHLSEFNT